MPALAIIPASPEQLQTMRRDPLVSDAGALRAAHALHGAEVLARLQRQAAPVVLDTCFGAGLQFLQLCAQFLSAAEAATSEDKPLRLHYIALIAHPPSAADLEELHAGWQAQSELASELRQVWPPLLPGTHRLLLQQGRVMLNLVFGEVLENLAQLQAGVDVFYLRAGTRPDWNPPACKRLARLAWTDAYAVVWQPQAEFAKGMKQAGFVGQQSGPDTAGWRFAPAWPRPPSHIAPSATPVPRQAETARRAIVIGAGLAGAAACERLAARGWQIDLVEQHAAPAQEASGNLAGIYMPALSRDDSALSRLTRAAYLFAIQLWRSAGGISPLHAADGSQGIAGETCGVLQLARDAEQADAFGQAAQFWNYPQDFAQWLDADQTSILLKTAAPSGWLFPQGGWIHPPSVCGALLHKAGAHVRSRYGQSIASLKHRDGEWQAHDAAGKLIAAAPVVIIANGVDALHIEQTTALPLQRIRGQVSHLPAEGFPALPFALCGDGYLTRPWNGTVSLGASYDKFDRGEPDRRSLLAARHLRRLSHEENLQRLRQMLPTVDAVYPLQHIDTDTLPGRVGFRCVAPDRLPLVGALPDMQAAWSSSATRLQQAPRLPGLYSLLAYASRGLMWAPLMAETLACMLEHEPLPLPRDLLAALDPARFAWKAGGTVGGATDDIAEV